MKLKPYLIISCLWLFFTAELFGTPSNTNTRITMELEGVPIITVLNMIAQQNNLNLVVSGEVTGDVTLRLTEVDIYTALNAILSPFGYNYYFNDDVIIIKPLQNDAPGELTTKIVTLKYADPITVKKALEPFSTDKGEIVILDKNIAKSGSKNTYKSNRILITDIPEVIDEMLNVIGQVDKQETLISIEVKIIETVIDDNLKVGFSWPTALTATLGGASDSTSGTSSTTSTSSAATYNPQNGDWQWAKLSIGQLQFVLDMLKKNGNSKLISDPRITTLENHEAEIKIETIIPIATINRFTEGAATSDIVTFQDEEVGISLRVTPRINVNNQITLEVYPKVEDIIGYTGPPDNQKPITTSRSVSTIITVEDGETAALGGLLKKNEIERIYRVPLLGHIPLLGKILFTNKTVDKTTTDLVILITPHILK